MVLTSSYGANVSLVVVGSTSTRMRSSTVTLAPMRPSSSIIVVTSCRCGTLPIVTGPSASSAPARIGSAAFLAPGNANFAVERHAAQDLQFVQATCSRQRGESAPRPSLPFGRGKGLDGQRMDFTSHALAEPGIHHLMTLQRTLALELRGDHDGLEMRVVVASSTRACAPGRPARIIFVTSSAGSWCVPPGHGRGRVRPQV